MRCLSRNPRDKRANRVVPHSSHGRAGALKMRERKMQEYTAERQVFMLGRDGHMPYDRIIRHWVRPRRRCCSETRRFSQRGKYASIGSEYLCAHRGRNLRPNEHVGTPTVCQSGKIISSASGSNREGAFLFQRVSVLVQRYNAVLLHDTLPATDCTD